MKPLRLLSGSDIRGHGTYDLDTEFLTDLCHAVLHHLNRPNPVIVIGKDSRLTGGTIESILVRQLIALGARVVLLVTAPRWKNVATTPMVFQAVQHYPADLGIMITASHLPPKWNGLKFFTFHDSYTKDEVRLVLNLVEEKQRYLYSGSPGMVLEWNFLDLYSEQCVNFIRKEIGQGETPLSALKILVDAGNGASGFFAEKILEPLGADCRESLYLTPDGHFPHHIPNPEDDSALTDLCRAVVDSRADLGIIFDTDGDRAAIVLSDGRPVAHNHLLALVSAMILRNRPGSTIVTDSVTSDGLTTFIESLGGIHHRYKRGYSNIRNEMKRLNETKTVCFAGGETSGHVMFTENQYADDGSYTVARFLIFLAQLNANNESFETVLQSLPEASESRVYRIPIRDTQFIQYGNQIIDSVIEYAHREKLAIDLTEGARVSFKQADLDGWVLIRLSLHEPLLVVNIESNAPGGLATLLIWVKKVLASFEQLDLTFF